jgi:hypothetical protein
MLSCPYRAPPRPSLAAAAVRGWRFDPVQGKNLPGVFPKSMLGDEGEGLTVANFTQKNAVIWHIILTTIHRLLKEQPACKVSCQP